MSIEAKIAEHYGREDLLGAITAALRAAGKDVERLTLEDLAPFDELHVRGGQATEELGAGLGLNAAMHVLDIGCGIGGPARRLASAWGCRVTGLDLNEEYCRAATRLTERVDLGERVSFRQGSALALPFGNGAFDAAYSQHAAMNIADKGGLYAEAARVLKPGGRLGIYNLLQGPRGDVIYPTPWAGDASTSFLIGPDELRPLLEAAGFIILRWRDLSAAGRVWAEAARERLAGGGPQPGPHRFRAEEFAGMVRNLTRNLLEGRVFPIEVICRKA